MANEIQTFEIVVATGVTKASPALTTIELGVRNVVKITVQVPPGPRGEVGFWLGSAGLQIIPKNAGTFIVTDNETVNLDLDGLFNSGSWTVAMYNTGHYAHTLRFNFHCDYVIGPSGPMQVAPIPSNQLSTG